MSSVREAVSSQDTFVSRHIGPSATEQLEMLRELGFQSLDQLVDATVPRGIRLAGGLDLAPALSEREATLRIRDIASKNHVYRSFIGSGYASAVVPSVIRRNILENPGWYTQYTPYQAEISQGRLEALLNYQTMVADLTGLPIANASLLDEGSAAAEAMILCSAARDEGKKNLFFVAEDCHPQTVDVLRTRAEPLGIELIVANPGTFSFEQGPCGVLLQYPTTYGDTPDYSSLIQKAKAAGAMVVMACDLLALTLLTPPGEMGADIAIGTTQRFGVPLFYGGPHAAFFATRDEHKRRMPGRLIGVSKDAAGNPALRMALQTREQHIRREKATSNICTAQVLLAIMAGMYAVYHGPEGLRRISKKISGLTAVLAAGARKLGLGIRNKTHFDTLTIDLGAGNADQIHALAAAQKMNFRDLGRNCVGITLDETCSLADVRTILTVLNNGRSPAFDVDSLVDSVQSQMAPARRTRYLDHPVFNSYHSETELLRYIKRLESKDLSLTRSMIPLGSCTMKLNAAAELYPVSWSEFADIHPFAPLSQTEGYQTLFRELESSLAECTGFHSVSLQPNSGAQGEYAGLMAIQRYQIERGQGHRKVCLIPMSAHGTNPASAVLAGMSVVPVTCDKDGNVDLEDLRKKAASHANDLACLMITYPSTHGVFEESIREICEVVHRHGGQVYMDGANLNAQVGLCRPGDFGPDICHLNLHKTFAIPHGGGGPGVGPVACKEHLAPFLPGHRMFAAVSGRSTHAVTSAPWGSAGVLPISYLYILMMGASGLRQATQVAMLNANYLAKRLHQHFPVLYRGKSGQVAHECIVDLRQLKGTTGIEVEDVAKRLMDYGFHAPTVSFPVPGTLMIEPTESESKAELDRFVEAMVGIRAEIRAIETGAMPKAGNLLKNAPHTANDCMAESWDRPYTREAAAFPMPWVRNSKFWPAVKRIDSAYGDRNLICTCSPMEAF